MMYSRLPRPAGIELTREQLRVYMMCNGQRLLDEVADITRLTATDLMRTVQELVQMNLLANGDVLASHQPGSPVAPSVEGQDVSGVDLTEQIQRLELVLSRTLGQRAAPFAAQLRACPDSATVQALVPRVVAKIKLTIDRAAGEALNSEFQQLFPG